MSGDSPKRALITGITGQDGSYLAELLLEKGYEVHGIIRRSSSFNTDRIDHLYHDPHEQGVRLFTHYGDLSDSVALVKLLYELQPDEIYHLGAQSHVRVSFDIPEYTFDVTGGGDRAPARGDPRGRREPALLPGVIVGDVRRGAAAAERADAVPPAQPLRRRQGRRLLGDGQLPRGLRHVRRQRDPLQPRVAAARRDLRHPQDHPRRRPDRSRAAGQALPRQPRRPARLGLRARLRRGDVDDAPGRGARRLRDRHRRDPHGARGASRSPSPAGPRSDEHVEIDPKYYRPVRGRLAARRRRARPRRSSAGSRRCASRSWSS